MNIFEKAKVKANNQPKPKENKKVKRVNWTKVDAETIWADNNLKKDKNESS